MDDTPLELLEVENDELLLEEKPLLLETAKELDAAADGGTDRVGGGDDGPQARKNIIMTLEAARERMREVVPRRCEGVQRLRETRCRRPSLHPVERPGR